MKIQRIFSSGDQPRPFQVLLPARLVEELRLEATQQGVSMAFLVRSALEKELSKRKEASR